MTVKESLRLLKLYTPGCGFVHIWGHTAFVLIDYWRVLLQESCQAAGEEELLQARDGVGKACCARLHLSCCQLASRLILTSP